MEDSTILVEILNGTQASGCNCSGCSAAGSCGPSSQEEMANKLAEDLREAFGSKVQVRYVDVDVVGLENYPVMFRVLQMGHPYPITLINGEPRYAGGIMIAEIKQDIIKILTNLE